MYKVLATQYDPLGYLIPFTTKAKILIQDLWKLKIGWDDIIHPESLLVQWQAWEAELTNLHIVEIPRAYIPPCADTEDTQRTIHIFCDASERAYGSVAYLHTQDQQNQIHVAFVMARSRVAPRKQISVPRLELCAALTGAQLAKLLSKGAVYSCKWCYPMDRFNNCPELVEIRFLSLQSLRRNTHRWNPGHDFGVKLAICQHHR